MENYSLTFEEILERCLVDIRNGSRSRGDCMAEYPQYQDELEPLLRVSERLYAAGTITASAQFRQQALNRFKKNPPSQMKLNASPYPIQDRPPMGNYGSPRRKSPEPLPTNRQSSPRRSGSSVFALLISVLLVFVLASTSIALAANTANPGGSFYPVRQVIEKVELGLAKSDLGEQQLHLKFANRRLQEVNYLLQHNRALYIDQPIENYLGHIASLSNLLYSSNLSDQERVMIATQLLDSPAMDENTLKVLYQRISPEQRAQIIAAINAAQTTRTRAQQVVNGLPEIRDQIREILLNTVDAERDRVAGATEILGSEVAPSRTPQPEATDYTIFVPDWTQIVPGSIPNWLTNTPDLARLATLYPTLYPTISNLATLYPTYYPTLSSLATQRPTLKATIHPPVNPTEIRPTRPGSTRATPDPVPPRPVATATP
jgi:hypothetical protein